MRKVPGDQVAIGGDLVVHGGIPGGRFIVKIQKKYG